MGIVVEWIGHASFVFRGTNASVCIDPWKLSGDIGNIDLLLVSHNHFDHCSAEDIGQAKGAGTVICGSADVPNAEALAPGQRREFGPVAVTGVPAYNEDKAFHPKSNGWLGFVVELDGKRIYYAGDTDRIPEMQQLQDIDLALLPVGGTYTMDAKEAAQATKDIGCRMAIPYHWGDVVGSHRDAKKFDKRCDCQVLMLCPGESVTV